MKIIYCLGHFFGILWRGAFLLLLLGPFFVILLRHLPRYGCFILSSVCHMGIAVVVGSFIGSLNLALCDVTNGHRHSEVTVCHS